MPPTPVPSPQHPKPSQHDTGELSIDDVKREAKLAQKQRKRRPWYYGLAGLLTAGGLGTGGVSIARGESQETKNARVELRQTRTEQDVSALAQKVDAGNTAMDKRVGKVERKVDAMRAEQRVYNQLILEKLGVPKSKQPKPAAEDEE